MKPDGEIVSVSACDRDERPPSQSVIDLLAHAFQPGTKRGPPVGGHLLRRWLREARFDASAPSPYPFGVLCI